MSSPPPRQSDRLPDRQSDARIETLFLDAGGVLIFPNWRRVSETLARHGVDVSPRALARAEPAVKFSIDTKAHVSSTSDAQRGGDLFNGVLDGAGVPRSPARDAALEDLYAYHARHNLWETIPDFVPDCLARLRASGLKLAVVSNANGVVHRVFERNGLARVFDAICDSCIEGVEKPDPRFFQLVLERLRSRPETTMHVGDLYYVDVMGARAAGVSAMLIDPDNLYAGFDVERVTDLKGVVDRLVPPTG